VRGAQLPFILDLDPHICFLLSVPVLLWAELVVRRRVLLAIRHFRHQDLIATDDLPRFRTTIGLRLLLRNSAIIQIILVGITYIAGIWLWREQQALHVDSWYGAADGDGLQLTLAGRWYAFVSLPFFWILLARWYFRLFLWYVVVWEVTRLALRAEPRRPVVVRGLVNFGSAVFAFAPILLAHSISLAGSVTNRIWHEHAKLADFKPEIATVVALIVALMLSFLFFSVHAIRAWQMGRHGAPLAGRGLGASAHLTHNPL
jgi:hypothetical protein